MQQRILHTLKISNAFKIHIPFLNEMYQNLQRSVSSRRIAEDSRKLSTMVYLAVATVSPYVHKLHTRIFYGQILCNSVVMKPNGTNAKPGHE